MLIKLLSLQNNLHNVSYSLQISAHTLYNTAQTLLTSMAFSGDIQRP